MNRWRSLASLVVLSGATLLACKKTPPTTAASAQPAEAAGPVGTAVAPPTAPRTGHDPGAEVLSQNLKML
jgi:hypothetical protein